MQVGAEETQQEGGETSIIAAAAASISQGCSRRSETGQYGRSFGRNIVSLTARYRGVWASGNTSHTANGSGSITPTRIVWRGALVILSGCTVKRAFRLRPGGPSCSAAQAVIRQDHIASDNRLRSTTFHHRQSCAYHKDRIFHLRHEKHRRIFGRIFTK